MCQKQFVVDNSRRRFFLSLHFTDEFTTLMMTITPQISGEKEEESAVAATAAFVGIKKSPTIYYPARTRSRDTFQLFFTLWLLHAGWPN